MVIYAVIYALLSALFVQWLDATLPTNWFNQGPITTRSESDRSDERAAVVVRIELISTITCQSTGLLPQDTLIPLFNASFSAQFFNTAIIFSFFSAFMPRRRAVAALLNHPAALSILVSREPYDSFKRTVIKGCGGLG